MGLLFMVWRVLSRSISFIDMEFLRASLRKIYSQPRCRTLLDVHGAPSVLMITSPVPRQVVQRDGSDQGDILIEGSYVNFPDPIEARAVVLGSGNSGTVAGDDFEAYCQVVADADLECEFQSSRTLASNSWNAVPNVTTVVDSSDGEFETVLLSRPGGWVSGKPR